MPPERAVVTLTAVLHVKNTLRKITVVTTLVDPIAKGGKAVYSEHRTFRLWIPGSGGFFLQTNHSEMSAF